MLARPAAIASLSQLVLKLTVPGVPDIYQGGELWDFSLVDPDNRRPVDWERRRILLDETDAATPADLAGLWQDGREKLFATWRLLGLRRALADVFAAGDYRPLEVEGTKSQHLCAFARSGSGATVVVAAPRLVWRLHPVGGASPDWAHTEIVMPAAQSEWHEIFTGRRFAAVERIRVADLLANFPVGVLTDMPPG